MVAALQYPRFHGIAGGGRREETPWHGSGLTTHTVDRARMSPPHIQQPIVVPQLTVACRRRSSSGAGDADRHPISKPIGNIAHAKVRSLQNGSAFVRKSNQPRRSTDGHLPAIPPCNPGHPADGMPLSVSIGVSILKAVLLPLSIRFDARTMVCERVHTGGFDQ